MWIQQYDYNIFVENMWLYVHIVYVRIYVQDSRNHGNSPTTPRSHLLALSLASTACDAWPNIYWKVIYNPNVNRNDDELFQTWARVSEFDYPKQEIAYYMGLLCYFPAVSLMAKPIGAGSSAHQAASLEP